MRWLGVAGWEITFDGHVLYFDPYVSRFDYTTNGGVLAPNPAVVDNLLTTGRLSGPPELVMVSHSHWDHIADVPQLLNRAEWASGTIRTIGTDTQRNLLTAMGVSAGRLANFITASGGEDLAFQGGAYQVQVLRSLHSQSLGYGYVAPGVRTEPPATPRTTADLVEGNTLAYQLTVPGRLKVLLFGGHGGARCGGRACAPSHSSPASHPGCGAYLAQASTSGKPACSPIMSATTRLSRWIRKKTSQGPDLASVS